MQMLFIKDIEDRPVYTRCKTPVSVRSQISNAKATNLIHHYTRGNTDELRTGMKRCIELARFVYERTRLNNDEKTGQNDLTR